MFNSCEAWAASYAFALKTVDQWKSASPVVVGAVGFRWRSQKMSQKQCTVLFLVNFGNGKNLEV